MAYRMKHFGIIFLVMSAVFAAGCSKNIGTEKKPLENAWIYDETLPVPIQFGMTGMDVKVKSSFNSLDDIEGERFGIIAMDPGSRKVCLDTVSAICEYDKVVDRHVFQFSEKQYYPYSSDSNYSFFAYYKGSNKASPFYDEDCVRYPVEGSHWGCDDIMWARADAKTLYVKHLAEINPDTGEEWGYVPAKKDVDATAYYDGFNAAYIRYIAKEKPEGDIDHSYVSNLPSLNFKHLTTNIRFLAVIDKNPATEFDVGPVIKSLTIKGDEIHTGADLIVAGYNDVEEGRLDVSSYPKGTVTMLDEEGNTELNVVPTPEGTPVGDGFFFQPLSQNSPLVLSVVVQAGSEEKTLDLTIDEHVEFKAGNYYTYELKVYRQTGLEVHVSSVAPWVDGWGDATKPDVIGDDDMPSEIQ